MPHWKRHICIFPAHPPTQNVTMTFCMAIWIWTSPLIALQVWCLAFTKSFEWLANGIVRGQNSLNSSGVKYAKTCKIHSVNHISCKENLKGERNKSILFVLKLFFLFCRVEIITSKFMMSKNISTLTTWLFFKKCATVISMMSLRSKTL